MIFLLTSTGNNLEIVEQKITTLLLDYHRLYIQLDGVTVEWIYSNICNEEFELQGFMIANGQAIRSRTHDILVGSSSSAQIPTSQLITETADVIYYRLVAVGPNRTVCSDRTSQDTYYGFEGKILLT